jgi:protein-disulfide isomerase
MRSALQIALAALMALFAAAAPAAAPRDWSTTVVQAPNGSFVRGNPKAPVKIVEYASYTCSHCAHFSVAVMPPLVASYVKRGQASIEFRNALRDRFDLVASLLARCAGPSGFYRVSDAIFAGQSDWLAAAAKFEDSPASDLDAIAPADRPLALAKGAALDALAAKNGVALAKQKACLADPAQAQAVAAMGDEAWNQRRIPGTPYVLVNDVPFDGVVDWPTLDARIGQALNKR